MSSWYNNRKIDRRKYLTTVQVKMLTSVWNKKAFDDLEQGRINSLKTYMIIQLGLQAGLRVAEIADLKISDCWITKGESTIFVRNGKGGKSDTIIIGNQLKTLISKFIDIKSQFNDPIDDESYLLCNPSKEKYSRRSLQLRFKTAIKKAGLPDYLSIHSLRHTFCCELMNNPTASGGVSHVKTKV